MCSARDALPTRLVGVYLKNGQIFLSLPPCHPSILSPSFTMSSSKIYEPLPPPSGKKDSSQPPLTPEQTKLQADVLAHFVKSGYVIPGVQDGQLTEEEKFWLSYECQLRYLRATKWKSADACIQRIESTLKWRREFGIYDKITSSYIEPEAVTGKEILFGYDTYGRPAFYMIPSRQNTNEATRQVEFAVWMLERAIDLMDEGVESLDLLINFADKAKNPSLSTARKVLSILQNHYPERLGKALVINVPYLVNMFFNMITPFIDPVTVKKLNFNIDVVKDGLFESDQVMKEWWGGIQDFEYQHDKYWSALNGMCERRKKEWMENWRKLGGKIGTSEKAYKTGKTAEAQAEPVPDSEKTEA
ncbi:hypothetical protein D9758_003628 [Tetrapyrgos nigripes]|uniref:CRAL-TRIO domain-containing protein n=1 Tax=Tetrapyrgos nigripes TaxID=182062 RepID=A0A8H5GMM7_9AGAR|nr:hypothetical protein D9758_003628 [Tetrapyrgos nigripes]